METIQSIALSIMDTEVIKYLRFNTYTAKRHFFICVFDESGDFGINILDGPVDLALDFLRRVNNDAINRLKTLIENALGCYEDIYMIYFVLFHEEGHWVEFLESGLDSKSYLKTIDISDYEGILRQADEKEYDWLYRSNGYEKRADAYALKRLKDYIESKK